MAGAALAPPKPDPRSVGCSIGQVCRLTRPHTQAAPPRPPQAAPHPGRPTPLQTRVGPCLSCLRRRRGWMLAHTLTTQHGRRGREAPVPHLPHARPLRSKYISLTLLVMMTMHVVHAPATISAVGMCMHACMRRAPCGCTHWVCCPNNLYPGGGGLGEQWHHPLHRLKLQSTVRKVPVLCPACVATTVAQPRTAWLATSRV